MIAELADMRLPAASICSPAKPLRSNRMPRKLASSHKIAFSESRSNGCIARDSHRCKSTRSRSRAASPKTKSLKRDVVSGVSSIAPRWKAQRRFPLNEMIELMVARSDNTAVETLFRIGGEGPAMAARFREWKVEGVRVDRSERQCGLDRNGVGNYPPPAEWTDESIDALIARTSQELRYRATQRFLADPAK